jgi:hypothetical protein
MRKELAAPFVIGLVVIAIAVTAVMYVQRGAHIELRGTILKVRIAPLDDNSSVAVVDFRFRNPADYPFIVRSVEVKLEDQEGNIYASTTVSETDARRLFEGYPLLGPKFNDTLIIRDKIPPKESQDRMVAARFELPESQLAERKRLFLRIEEIDGAVSEVSEGTR